VCIRLCVCVHVRSARHLKGRLAHLHGIKRCDLLFAANSKHRASKQIVLHCESNPKARAVRHCVPRQNPVRQEEPFRVVLLGREEREEGEVMTHMVVHTTAFS
jgi:hypothetical protein